jgi:hypothetical protein
MSESGLVSYDAGVIVFWKVVGERKDDACELCKYAPRW